MDTDRNEPANSTEQSSPALASRSSVSTMADLAPAPPKKRALPFKRTVERTPVEASTDLGKPDDDNVLDMFRHAAEDLPELLWEAEEKVQRERDSKRRRTSLETTPAQAANEPQTPRKRSVALDNTDGSDDDLIMDVKGKDKEVIRARRPSTPRAPVSARAASRTPGSTRSGTRTPGSRRASKTQNAAPTSPVTISDDEDDDDAEYIPPGSRQTRLRGRSSHHQSQPPLDDDHNDDINPHLPTQSDDDDPDVQEIDPPPTTQPPEPAEADDFSEWIARARALQAAQASTPHAASAVVTVIVTSQLTITTTSSSSSSSEGDQQQHPPVLAKRRLNQGVQLLLDVWVAQARARGMTIPDEVAQGLFLTWKGNKIYGQSTLASLGVQVDAGGKLKREGGGIGGGGSGEGYMRDGLHLEVWTEEAYAEFLEQRERERAMRLAAAVGDEDGEEGKEGGSGGGEGAEEEVVEVPQLRRKGIKIVLKAKEHEPLKLTTKEDTVVEALVEAFRAQRDIGPEWDVAIWFDGERLDDDSLVKDIDIDPDEANQLEVHVKRKAGR